MTREIITQILETEGAKSSGSVFAIREDREATCFVSAPGDVLQIPRVVKIDLRDKFLSLHTVKDERFLFAYEDVLGFRLAAQTVKDRTTGFSG
jgi:hypothetical protein